MICIKKNFLRFLRRIKKMIKIEVDFKDYRTGVISPIEIIEEEQGYTPADYLADYKLWCDCGLESIYNNGKILFFEVE